MLNLESLGSLPADEAGPLARYASTIQAQRHDYNGKVLSIRTEDLKSLAIIYDMSPDELTSRLIEWGVLSPGMDASSTWAGDDEADELDPHWERRRSPLSCARCRPPGAHRCQEPSPAASSPASSRAGALPGQRGTELRAPVVSGRRRRVGTSRQDRAEDAVDVGRRVVGGQRLRQLHRLVDHHDVGRRRRPRAARTSPCAGSRGRRRAAGRATSPRRGRRSARRSGRACSATPSTSRTVCSGTGGFAVGDAVARAPPAGRRPRTSAS